MHGKTVYIWKHGLRFHELCCLMGTPVNTFRPRQNGRHFADEILNAFSGMNMFEIPIAISLKFVPKGPINNIPALVYILPCGRPGDKPLSEAMMVSLQMHICVTRLQWVNGNIQCVNEFVWLSVLGDNLIIFDQGYLCTNMPHLPHDWLGDLGVHIKLTWKK